MVLACLSMSVYKNRMKTLDCHNLKGHFRVTRVLLQQSMNYAWVRKFRVWFLTFFPQEARGKFQVVVVVSERTILVDMASSAP